MTNNCPQYNQLLENWKEKLNEIDKLYQEFKTTGDKETKKQIEELKIQAKQAKKEYKDFANETVEFDSEEMRRIDADRLNKIKSLIDGGELSFEVEKNEISIITIGDTEAEEDQINKALSFVKHFDGLQKLSCFNNPNLLSLPELPDSLRELYCYNNPNLSSLPELPDGLRELLCSGNPNLSSLPELPESLQWLDLENTPASKNPETIQQLKDFQAKYPDVVIKGVDLN